MREQGLIRRLLPKPVLTFVRLHLHSIKTRRIYGGDSLVQAIAGHIGTLLRPNRTILFYPEAPWFAHLSFKLCVLSGYRMTTDPRKRYDIAFKRKGATFFEAEALAAVPGDRARIVNARSTDISKRRVGRCFSEVFGYAIEVDPTVFVGPMFEKSDLNAVKDGRIVEGPLLPEDVTPGSVYQRLVDTTSDDGEYVVDHRVPLYGGRSPLVYVKHRVMRNRFRNWNAHVSIHSPETLFSRDELDRLSAFMGLLGIDYGEIDVLRDKDGRIYVVDANNTPAGPPNGMTRAEEVEATRRLRIAFAEFLDEWEEAVTSPDPELTP